MVKKNNSMFYIKQALGKSLVFLFNLTIAPAQVHAIFGGATARADGLQERCRSRASQPWRALNVPKS